MLGFKHIQFAGSLTSTASSTATIFAAGGSGTKWCLTKGLITCVGPVADATLSMQETGTNGTALNVIYKTPLATWNAPVAWDFGDHGFEAAATNTRLVWLIEGANASANMICVGYYR